VKRASDILASVYRQSGDPEATNRDLIFCYWKEAAGGRLAQISRPIHFTGSLLVVEVDSPEWIAALEAVRTRIHAKLNAAIGSKAVGRIMFRASSTLRKPAAKAETADPSLQVADGIRDPQLRRVYLASKRAAEKGR
jgi:hypothetical protein